MSLPHPQDFGVPNHLPEGMSIPRSGRWLKRRIFIQELRKAAGKRLVVALALVEAVLIAAVFLAHAQVWLQTVVDVAAVLGLFSFMGWYLAWLSAKELLKDKWEDVLVHGSVSLDMLSPKQFLAVAQRLLVETDYPWVASARALGFHHLLVSDPRKHQILVNVLWRLASVDNEIIYNLAALRDELHTPRAWLVTNRLLSEDAAVLAERLGVEVFDRAKLDDLRWALRPRDV